MRHSVRHIGAGDAYRHYGYGFIGDHFVTLMGSYFHCPDPSNCLRILRFSDARETEHFEGQPVGDCQSDAATLLKETGPILANIFERLPSFTQHPQSTLLENNDIEFQVVTRGEEPLSYSWYRNNEVISGQTGSTLTIRSPTASDAGLYHARVCNNNGCADSYPAMVSDPVITEQPEYQTVQFGNEFTLKVSAQSQGQLAYQWFKDGTLLTGQTSQTYTVDKASADDEAVYHVRVDLTKSVPNNKDKFVIVNSVRSDSVKVDVTRIPPEIIFGPESEKSIEKGKSGIIEILLKEEPSYKYQWYHDGVSLGEKGTHKNYQIQNAKSEDAGIYHVEITLDGETVKSDNSTVDVTPE